MEKALSPFIHLPLPPFHTIQGRKRETRWGGEGPQAQGEVSSGSVGASHKAKRVPGEGDSPTK